MNGRHGLEIRAAYVADAAGLADLLGVTGQPISASDLARRIEAIRNGSGMVLIASEWGPPSGVVVLHWFPRLDTAPRAHIDLLVVAPDERRRGLGRLLVKAAARAARAAGCDQLELYANDKEHALRAFCGATGFSGEGTRYRRGLRRGG